MAEKKPRKKAEPKPRIKTSDWRNLPYDKWNTLTVTSMVTELHAERFGELTYVPFRNWSVERGVIKRNLTQYGGEVIAEFFTQAFAEYRPTPQYPILTAGFALSYVASRIIPQILASRQRKELAEKARELADANTPSEGDVIAWL
jgi:hypothetical protein